MKKNMISRMTMPRESATSRFRRWNILPRVICLLLALAIWLLVVNLNETNRDGQSQDSVRTEQSA